jgi:uncharacterized protein (DUF2267 family)
VIHPIRAMKYAAQVEFLKTKEAAFLAVTGHPPGHAGLVTTILGALPKVTLTTLVGMDRELDMMMAAALPHAARVELAQILEKQFGYGHLSRNPDLIIQRILRRRKIANPADAELVVNLLASVDDDSVSGDQRKKLELILHDYENSIRTGTARKDA